jgi:hypothetical protein
VRSLRSILSRFLDKELCGFFMQSIGRVSTNTESRALLAFLLAAGPFDVIPPMQIAFLKYLTAYVPR